MAWKSSFRQNYRTKFSPTVPTSAAGISHVMADVAAPGGEKWEHLKSEGKQWHTTPKNLPRMQRTRAIPVAWLNPGLCPDRPKGWIIIIIIRLYYTFWISDKNFGLIFISLKCLTSTTNLILLIVIYPNLLLTSPSHPPISPSAPQISFS